MGPFTEYCAPQSLDEALAVLADRGGATCILAGGTDVMVRLRRGLLGPGLSTLLSVHRIPGLRGIRQENGELIVGAATTATDLLRSPLIGERAPILARVADRVASAQIRNLATVGGNLANASPAGDLINPLLLLDARLVLASAVGRRGVSVADYFTGPGETVRRPDELLVEVRFDVPPPEREFRFEKAGTRPAMECSVVTVGVAWTPREGRFHEVRVAFGSSAPVPLRGRESERALEGQPVDAQTIEKATRAAEGEVSPISDIRGSEAYRRVLVGVFLRRLLDG
jgi:carbon-monoxide dehydrogenase medium subunit